jgi:Fe-S-cluster containining protein
MRVPDTRTSPAVYRRLLEQLDRWMAEARRGHPGIIPCRAGCAACCHGPFDVTAADVELMREAVDRLAEAERAEIGARARALLTRMCAEAPDWNPPFDVAQIGDDRFDAVAESLGTEPCPLLGSDGRCRIYEDRPMVCRLIGLPMRSPAGRVIENACPIQAHYPRYAALEPRLFDLEEFEMLELECLQGAARRLLGDASRWEFETTIAAVFGRDRESECPGR